MRLEFEDAEKKLKEKEAEVKKALEKLDEEEKKTGKKVLKLHGIGRKIRLAPIYETHDGEPKIVKYNLDDCYVQEG